MLILLAFLSSRASEEKEGVRFVGVSSDGLQDLALLVVILSGGQSEAGHLSLNRPEFHLTLLCKKEGRVGLHGAFRFRGSHSILFIGGSVWTGNFCFAVKG